MRVATDGCGKEVHLFGKKIYFEWNNPVLDIETLGEELDKTGLIQSRIKEEYKNDKVKLLTSKNPALFRYLCQISYKQPNMINYFDRYWE